MIILILAVLGLALGSFVNALVFRLHEQAKRRHKLKKTNIQKVGKREVNLSIATGRSVCTHCGHELGPLDLVPILSWLMLRGKCRYCHKPIEDTPLAELGLAILFVSSYIWWPFSFDAHGTVNFVIWLVMLVGFMALIIYDIRWLILPNKIIYPLIALAAVTAILNVTVFDGGTVAVRDAVIALVIAGGVFYALFQLSGGKWIGGGDVKLGILIGFLIAVPLQAFLVLFLASVIGMVAIIPGLVMKKLSSKSHVPFGPFLIIATIIVKLFGASLIAWYRRKFLLY